jgi:hypothetical protein
VFRTLTARAATRPTVRSEAIDSISFRAFIRTLSGIASVGAEGTGVGEGDVEVVEEDRAPISFDRAVRGIRLCRGAHVWAAPLDLPEPQAEEDDYGRQGVIGEWEGG